MYITDRAASVGIRARAGSAAVAARARGHPVLWSSCHRCSSQGRSERTPHTTPARCSASGSPGVYHVDIDNNIL